MGEKTSKKQTKFVIVGGNLKLRGGGGGGGGDYPPPKALKKALCTLTYM